MHRHVTENHPLATPHREPSKLKILFSEERKPQRDGMAAQRLQIRTVEYAHTTEGLAVGLAVGKGGVGFAGHLLQELRVFQQLIKQERDETVHVDQAPDESVERSGDQFAFAQAAALT